MGQVQMVQAPERSLEQRMTALERANEVRSYRAELKRKVKAGKAAVPAVLDEPPAEVETMKVFDLLVAAPKVGRVKANKLLRQVAVSPSKTVGGLSARQRGELLAALGTRR